MDAARRRHEAGAGGIQLELLTGPLTGIYDPNGMGAMFFAVLAVAGQIERNYIRERTLEGQVTAAAKGNHGGRPKVIDDDMLTFAVALKDKGVPVPEIAKKLVIKTGKNAGKNPSVASLCRALAEAEEAAADDGLPLRPKPVRIRRPEDPLTPRRSASATVSRPSPARTRRSAARPRDQCQRQRLCRCSPRPEVNMRTASWAISKRRAALRR
ncbi:recombinase family protein [Streptomyces sp. NPDC056637]|uniref:recombinase family protein n=1 Tax=unclassified Streptomyces TaxID=2593676 RepID=UPI0036333F5C